MNVMQITWYNLFLKNMEYYPYYILTNFDYSSMTEQNVLTHYRKSNLLHPKPSQPNGLIKQNQIRVRGSFFAQMLQNIKGNSYTRQRLFHKQEQQYQNALNQQNLAIIIQAKNLKVTQKPQQFFSFHPHRNPSGNSKTFLIRSHPKKPILDTGSSKQITQPHNIQQLIVDLHDMNLSSIRQLSQPTDFYMRKEHKQFPSSDWAILIPFSILKKSPSSYSPLFHFLLEKNFQIYVVVTRKQDYERLQQNILNDYCHILYCHQKNKPEQYCFMNIQEIPNSPNHLLIFQSSDYPFARIFPFTGQDSIVKVSFLKIREFIKIREINRFCDRKVQIKMEKPRITYKNRMKIEYFDLGNNLKLQLQSLHRKKARRKSKHYTFENEKENGMEIIQQKLLQYVKIVKSESRQHSKGKSSNKKQSSKSSYQVINELTRANFGIHKQIKNFVQQSKQIGATIGKQIGAIISDSTNQIIYHLLD